jgi:hypothetical protein
MYFCEQQKCKFNVCKSCVTSNQIKDPKGHHLRLKKLNDFKCSFCNLRQYPNLKCVFRYCSSEFSICMRCASSHYKKSRCGKGHPLKKIPERIDYEKISCSDCGLVRKDMRSCATCMFDLCQGCINRDSDKMLDAPVQPETRP